MVWIGVVLSALLVAICGLAFQYFKSPGGTDQGLTPGLLTALTFVGSETCATCHQTEAQSWKMSQHQHAMAHATDATVLGDFANASFDYFGIHSRFFHKDDKFLVETDGPDGKLATFEVKYTFGIDPLQQYLVEFPDGRLQALSIAWDTRPEEKGGQRWFHLYPDEGIRHDDVLHWTKLNQNWNFMCAECHSTDVHKNYDAVHDRFATHFAEISVGCEACHGQGSRHVTWAREKQSWWPFAKQNDPTKGFLVSFDERAGVTWSPDPATGLPRRSAAPATLRKEVETCGLCHARRSAFSEDWVPGRWLSDTHGVSLLSRGLFEADGQMRDEVYNYGAFKQSKMFAAGVTCSDCHEPHGAKLRIPGNGVCLQCHATDRYETVAHHHHHYDGATPALACTSCHMPQRTYMVIDQRHDHSFRIPRPDLSAKLGTPNACNGCHTGKPPEWAASAIEQWYGPDRKGFQNYAAAFHSSWTDMPDAAVRLAAVAGDRGAPALARASALTELGGHVTPSNFVLARNGLSDPDPTVRIAALDMLQGLPGLQIWPLVSTLLSDESLGVRIRAAALLASVPTASQPPADRERFERAAAEFIAAQRLNDDRPEARSMLASFLVQRNRFPEAEIEYRAALHLSAAYTTAAINLADLYRHLGRETAGEAVLREAIAASPKDAGVHHALGLTLVRLKRQNEALTELRQAAELAPDQARFAYVYAVALHGMDRGDEALGTVKTALARHPNDHGLLSAAVTFSRNAGDIPMALRYAEQLAQLSPEDRDLASLVMALRQQLNAPIK
ncbi:tetratricopeptide repeat protein [Beijerinckia indica]|nr:cytochrome c3 family protein [Beijerinckia indica]